MPTYYKPSQWRGKRLVYRSIDPAESKRETIKGIALFIGSILFVLFVTWFSSKTR